MKDICREHGISVSTYANWKAKYGGMEASDIKKMKQLEEENSKLKRLKRLVEAVVLKGCKLPIILARHPKLGNSLSKASMEEIGTRTKIFRMDDAVGNKEKYIAWLLQECLHDKKKLQEIITPEAIQKLATALQTPLQIQHYLTQAIQLGHQLGEKIITQELLEL